MSNSQKLPHLVVRIALCLVLGCPLLPRSAYGQATQGKTDELTTSIAKIQSGGFTGVDIKAIVKANAVQAVPVLEKRFGPEKDALTRGMIAGALVRLGDRDNIYWNYLLEQAIVAVDSNIPDAVYSESQGKVMIGASSPELKTWADAHNISLQTAGQYARYDYPYRVGELGETGDPRGILLLRRALQSHNYLLAAMAAKGLAQIQDKESIPLIIAACERAPEGWGAGIASNLIYFDDPRAQSAVDKFLPSEYAKTIRDLRASGRRPFD